MAKKINLIVNSCAVCPYYRDGIGKIGSCWKCGFEIVNLHSIHAKCTLEDIKEKTKDDE